MILSWVYIILFGSLAGIIGQGIRLVVGIRKSPDLTIAYNKAFTGVIIGAIAGALAALTIIDPTTVITKQIVLGLIASGYAGTDFIEGIMKNGTQQTKV